MGQQTSKFSVIAAMVIKELKLTFRYPKNVVATQMINPLRMLIVFWLVYKSFFLATHNQGIGEWQRMNYGPALILGTLFYTVATTAFYRFRWNFISEKYWKTIQVLLISPVSKLEFLVASSIALAIELSVAVTAYLILFTLYFPTNFSTLLYIATILYAVILGMLGLGLMQGAFSICNENYLFLFDYFYTALIFLSCFYYSPDAIPEKLRILSQLNPLYHAVEMARTMIFHHLTNHQMVTSTGFLLTFAIAMPVLGAVFFRQVIRNLGVRGF